MDQRKCGRIGWIGLAWGFLVAWAGAEGGDMDVVLETNHLRVEAASDAKRLCFVEKSTGKDLLDGNAWTSIGTAVKDGVAHPCTSVSLDQDALRLLFEGADLEAEIRVCVQEEALRFRVKKVSHQAFDELRFLDIPLGVAGSPEDPFACCVLALNLKTNVEALPGPQKLLRASCYPRTGCEGAEAALLACPKQRLRDAMKRVVSNADELPRTDVGGPWALDAPINRGSYLFDFGDLTEKTVEEWILLVKRLGLTQIDFHTGKSLRFGDCRPNPDLFPNGRESVKKVIDRLHDAGLRAGLHTYAFFIAKDTPYVTPVPDPRLGKDATFTLSEPLDSETTSIPVEETTEGMSTTTGFFVRNSVTLMVEEELITYAGISKKEPFAFTGCVRGALGTKQAKHPKGAPVHHLKECFGLFCPGADSSLLEEIASNTAETYNECGFDMIYLDALDGEDILAGREWSWHYGSKFVFEIAKRLEKPALFEMSTFHHHLWFVRGRMGAWDHPSRAHKRFIDVHCAANHSGRGMFLPMNLGWWATKTWSEGPFVIQIEPTFPDDIEYLLGKCLGYDMGLALMGVNPKNIDKIPAYERLAPLFKTYETLRRAGTVPNDLKQRLRRLGDEFRLEKDGDSWRLRPVCYDHRKMACPEGRSGEWQAKALAPDQGLRLRIEPLMCVGGNPEDVEAIVEDFEDLEAWTPRAREGVKGSLSPGNKRTPAGERACVFSAATDRATLAGSWIQMERRFDPPLELGDRQALGLWVYGDAGGAVLNVQLRSPEHTTHGGCGDHYIDLDFEGWRYVELVEPETARVDELNWPYGGAYAVYREMVDYRQIDRLSLWFNRLPKGETQCLVGPIRALPITHGTWRNVRISLNGGTFTVPLEMRSGMFVECHPRDGAFLFDSEGREIEARPWTQDNQPPRLRQGENALRVLAVEGNLELDPRFKMTVMSLGEGLDPAFQAEDPALGSLVPSGMMKP